ncbi:hypothetical protein F5Y17DRAFT_23863 [Xylariaceae sp. FL0594]|nr:hypothetical protein F5Y17DRAFT_23863 [Xylariaceae sp. FL0594]
MLIFSAKCLFPDGEGQDGQTNNGKRCGAATAGHPQRYQKKVKTGDTNNTPKTKEAKCRKKQSALPKTCAKSTSSFQSESKGTPTPGIVGRPTPAILVEENRIQELKLAKPAVPTQIPSREPLSQRTAFPKTKRVHTHGEIDPPAFYHSTSDLNADIAIASPQALAMQFIPGLRLLGNSSVNTTKASPQASAMQSIPGLRLLGKQPDEACPPSAMETPDRRKGQWEAAKPECSVRAGIANAKNHKRQRIKTPSDWLTPSPPPKRNRQSSPAGLSRDNMKLTSRPQATPPNSQVNSNQSPPLTPLSGNRGRQESWQMEASTSPSKPSRPCLQNNTGPQKSGHDRSGPWSSAAFRSQTAPPRMPHFSDRPIESIERGDPPVAVTRQKSRHSKPRKSKSRKPSVNRPYERENRGSPRASDSI